jgi:hypothetical protein
MSDEDLKLKKETVRVLSAKELALVGGGVCTMASDWDDTWYSFWDCYTEMSACNQSGDTESYTCIPDTEWMTCGCIET